MRIATPLPLVLLCLTLTGQAWAERLTDLNYDQAGSAVQPTSATFHWNDKMPVFALRGAVPNNRPTRTPYDAGSAGTYGCDIRPVSCDTYPSIATDRAAGWLSLRSGDPCRATWISPLTNPFYFETPRTVTEARLLYAFQSVPQEAWGGDANLLALQLRAALTERLSVIVNKSGFLTSSNALVDDGWLDLAAGLKFALLADTQAPRLLSVGLTYELPTGSTQALQANGNGMFNLVLSGGLRQGRWQALSASGLILPADGGANGSLWYWSNHLSGRLGDSSMHVLTELHWYHWMGAGDVATAVPSEGGDLFHTGAAGVAGNDILTQAIGLRYQPRDQLELGVAWELPLTRRRDALDNRLTADCILRY